MYPDLPAIDAKFAGTVACAMIASVKWLSNRGPTHHMSLMSKLRLQTSSSWYKIIQDLMVSSWLLLEKTMQGRHFEIGNS